MGLNAAYDREETRGFLKRRITALAMIILLLVAFVLAFGLLVLGPHVSAGSATPSVSRRWVNWLWWTAQWPILILGLLLAFATVLYLGPDVDHPRWSFLTFGTAIAVVVWLVASGAFALYVGQFGSYNKAWGLARRGDHHADLALDQRARAPLRRRGQRGGRAEPRAPGGEPAEADLQAPPKGLARALARDHPPG